MKKVVIAAIATVMCMGLMAGCATLLPTLPGGEGEGGGGGGKPATALEGFEEKYEKIAEAKVIAQSITVTLTESGLLQYSREKTYEKAGSGYAVETKEKRINDLDADTAYTETELSETVMGRADIELNLRLDELYLKDLEIDETAYTLEAEVREGSAESMLRPAPVHGMHLGMTADAAHLEALTLTYATGNSDVVIVLTFTY